MSHDTLFQLGVGSVLLNASQKEENLVTRALAACFGAIRIGRPSPSPGRAGSVVAGLFRADKKSRSNSAKALILPTGSAAALQEA
jgi:hypothetical protein